MFVQLRQLLLAAVEDDVGEAEPLVMVKSLPMVGGAEHGGGGDSGQFLAGPVPGHHLMPGIDDEGGDGGILHQVLGKLLLFQKPFLDSLAFADVEEGADDAVRFTIGGGKDRFVKDDVMPRAVRVGDRAFVDLGGPGLHQLPVGPVVDRRQIGWGDVMHGLAQQTLAVDADIGFEGLVATEITELGVLEKDRIRQGVDQHLNEMQLLVESALVAIHGGEKLVEGGGEGADFILGGDGDGR